MGRLVKCEVGKKTRQDEMDERNFTSEKKSLISLEMPGNFASEKISSMSPSKRLIFFGLTTSFLLTVVICLPPKLLPNNPSTESP